MLLHTICSEDELTSLLMQKHSAPGCCSRMGRLGARQLSYSILHEGTSQATVREELLPHRGSFPLASWPLAWCRGHRGDRARARGRADWYSPRQGTDRGGLPYGTKRSSKEDSPHSSFSKHRLKMCSGKVKLCGNSQSHPLKIISPFTGITHLTPS